jgi:hypothetical protein
MNVGRAQNFKEVFLGQLENIYLLVCCIINSLYNGKNVWHCIAYKSHIHDTNLRSICEGLFLPDISWTMVKPGTLTDGQGSVQITCLYQLV